MSAAEQQSGCEPSAESLDLAALRASLRCGRSLPVRHLAESEEAFTQRWQAPIFLCSADVAEPEPDVEDLDCPGCWDCVRYCPDCVREAHRWSAESAPREVEEVVSTSPPSESGDDPGHPAWCSPQHCYRTDEGERVHLRAPVRWEDCGVRFEITLVGPEDDDRTYVELRLALLMFAGSHVYAAMPVPAARRLRDELSAHLDTAAAADSMPPQLNIERS